MRDSTSLNRNIELHIEELVLEGFAVRDVSRITSAMQSELEQLVSRGNDLTGIKNRNTAQIEGGTIQIQPGATPETTGKQIAQNLYRGLASE